MRSVSRRRAADFVRPALSEARVARMWTAIAAVDRPRSRSLPSPARRWGGPVVLAAAALAAALLVGLRGRPTPGPALTGLVIDTGAATQEVSLTEGSTLHLAAATRLRVLGATAGEVRLRLDHGSVICDVVHRDDRRFIVEAGGVEVEDRGTRFAVDVSPGRRWGQGPQTPGADHDVVEVHVERGAVEVHDAARAVIATLQPGQAWKSAGPVTLDAGASTPAEQPPPGPEEIREHSPTPPPPVGSAAPVTMGETPKPPARGGASSPEALFERADGARLAGHHAEAAAAFERFHRRFPNDPRSGLAAYELGRIRLGSLHDPRGAAEAFGAVLERPDDPFREDAEAGRVEALADLGDDEGCKRARDAFRARYPRSPQAGRVAKLCGR